ncbi:DNA topoisomerase IB [Belliella marina]|uniref:DNA topoisomerase n=1 Tax=Belliella marina TaxID=1644146 RepID=A0ABW4VPQ3_9BACT
MDKHRNTTLANEQIAKEADLKYMDCSVPGINRRVRGKGFSFHFPDGNLVTDPKVLKRIKELAIPPAWSKVWVCKSAQGHIQATGYDKRKRKQYLYHQDWVKLRSETKFFQLYQFGKKLPKIRKSIAHDIGLAGLPVQKVLATVVSLLLKVHARIGNIFYEDQNGTYGLTTLRDEHVTISKNAIELKFPGKKNINQHLSLHSSTISKIIRKCRDLPGETLFQYIDKNGKPQAIDSCMVNSYIRSIGDAPFTAKDFRTWSGSVLAVEFLLRHTLPESMKEREKLVLEVIRKVAKRLGNTPTICRKYYIHPLIIGTYCSDNWEKLLSGKTSANHFYNKSEKLLLKLLKADQ